MITSRESRKRNYQNCMGKLSEVQCDLQSPRVFPKSLHHMGHPNTSEQTGKFPTSEPCDLSGDEARLLMILYSDCIIVVEHIDVKFPLKMTILYE